MKRVTVQAWACALASMLLAGCAATPAAPPGTVAPNDTIDQAVQPGVTTRAMLLARFGATTSIRFDSGVEVWRYLVLAPAGAGRETAPAGAGRDTAPAGAGRYGEYVIVLDARGVVARARRASAVYQWPPPK